MRNRSIAIITALVMALTIVGFVPKEVSAAENEFMLINNAWTNNDIREKVGDYYIWIDDIDNYNYNKNYDRLQCAKKLGVTPRTLAKCESGGMCEEFVTDGNTLYFAMYDDSWDHEDASIYVTDINGNYINEVCWVYDYLQMAGFYNGELYYVAGEFEEPELYKVNVSTGETEYIVDGYYVTSAYGKRFILQDLDGDKCIYDVQSGVYTELPESEKGNGYVLNGNMIYYWVPDRNIYQDYGDYYADKFNLIFKKCSVGTAKGTEITRIENPKYLLRMNGHGYAFFEKKTNISSEKQGLLYKLDYETGKLTRYMVSLPKPSVTAASSDYTAVKVSWKSVANAQKYEVYRSTSKSGTYSLLTTTTNLSYIDKELTTGKSYYYKVRALREDVVGKFSDIKSAKPTYRKPLNVKAKGALKSATITWSKVNGAEGYQVYRAVKKTGKYTKVKTVKGTKFKNTGLKKNKKYYYKVRAYGTVNGSVKYGNFSKIVYCTTGRK